MDTTTHDSMQRLPKADLHVHLEGTLEPAHTFSLAKRDGIVLEYETPADVVAAHDSRDLPSFLMINYAAAHLLRKVH